MSQDKPFQISLSALKSKAKQADPAQLKAVEEVSEELGFVTREAGSKRGRKASPRTGQVHAKVLPAVAEGISCEARRRGVQQGVILEEAWQLYLDRLG